VLRGVILDYGGVLSLEPADEALARLHRLCELDAEVFAEAWLEHRHGYDLGELSAADYWALVAGRRYDDDLLARVIEADVDSWSRPNLAMIDWLLALKRAGLRVGLLSNMPREHWLEFERRHDWLAACDHVTVSWEQRAVKPDEAIYRSSLEGLGLEPAEALFVDDRADNVAAAEALGLTAIHFTDLLGLRAQLSRRYGDALPLPVA
jgi:putative hydrolase of the HAD superfamily